MSQLDDLRGPALGDTVRAIRSRLWLVLLVVGICTATAFVYSNSQTRLYQASARLMYQPPTDISNPTATTSSVNTDSMAIQLQSVSSSIDNPSVRTRALQLADVGAGPPEFTVTTSVVNPDNNTASASFPNVVQITVQTGSPEMAAKIANAYALAIIALRKESQQGRYRAAQKVVADQLKLYESAQAKLTPDYAALTQQLRNLKIAEATATGDFTVIVPAVAPVSPSSPQPFRSAALGLAGGLIVGIALAFLVARFDTRVRSHREVADLLGWPVIGRLPRVPRHLMRKSELPVLSEPEGHMSEALRILRSNLEWANVDGGLKTLLVTSCVKGEGKTLTACNLAVTLARAGKHVVVIDGDLRAPRVHTVFGLPNSIGLTSMVRGTASERDALQVFHLSSALQLRAQGMPITEQEPLGESASVGDTALAVLTSGPLPPDPGEFVASRRLAKALAEVANLDADYVLIDAPPVLSIGDAGVLSTYADGILVVANIDTVRRPTLIDGREQLEALPCRKVGVVVVGERLEHQEHYRNKYGRSS